MKKIAYCVLVLFFTMYSLLAQKELDTVSTFDMYKLPKSVNSVYHEGGPVISFEGDKLYFFRTNHPENKYGKEGSQDIWYSEKNAKGDWSQAVLASPILNRYQSNQVFSVLDQGNTLLMSGGNRKNSLGFSLVTKSGTDWANPIELEVKGFEKMSKGNYYGASITEDKKVLVMYFSEIENSINSDLYVSFQESGYNYSSPVKMPLSTVQDDLSPFICENGKTMYYSSGLKGGLGQVDIYEVTRSDDTWMTWTKPKNMGRPLNSNGFDAYFSTEASLNNAYTTRAHMSSDGGSLDIWNFVKRPEFILKGHIYDKKTKKPIETPFQILITGKGSLEESSNLSGFYVSKVKDKGKLVYSIHVDGYEGIEDTLDLRKFPDSKEINKDFYLMEHPKPVALSGTIYNKKTNEIIGHAKIDIEDKFSHKQHVHSNNDDGMYHATLPDIGRYRLMVHKHGFYTATEIFEIKDGVEPLSHTLDIYLSPKERPITLKGNILNEKTMAKVIGDINFTSPSGEKGIIHAKNGTYSTQLPEPGFYKFYTAVTGFMANNDTITVFVPFDDKVFEKDILLTPIEIGATVVLKEIYFDFNKATLRKESVPELKRAIEFMNANKTVSVEISGHTDSWGSDEYNEKLSQDRAESVVKYLIDHGISSERLQAKGYGELKPKVEELTDEDRQTNRRVEFTILKV